MPGAYSGSFSNLNGATLRVDKNFYNNGANMLSAGNWNLTIIDNDDNKMPVEVPSDRESEYG